MKLLTNDKTYEGVTFRPTADGCVITAREAIEPDRVLVIQADDGAELCRYTVADWLRCETDGGYADAIQQPSAGAAARAAGHAARGAPGGKQAGARGLAGRASARLDGRPDLRRDAGGSGRAGAQPDAVPACGAGAAGGGAGVARAEAGVQGIHGGGVHGALAGDRRVCLPVPAVSGDGQGRDLGGGEEEEINAVQIDYSTVAGAA